MASCTFAKASSSVAPCDQHPGSLGQETLYPSSVGLKATGYLMPLAVACDGRARNHAVCSRFGGRASAEPLNSPQNPRRIPHHDRTWGCIPGYDAARSDDFVLANSHLRQNHRLRSDRRALLDKSGLHFPVAFGLQLSTGGGRPRVRVLGERLAVANENVVFNRHAFAGKSRRGWRFCSSFQLCILPDLDERNDPGVVVRLATVEIDEFRQLDILLKLDVGSCIQIVVHEV